VLRAAEQHRVPKADTTTDVLVIAWKKLLFIEPTANIAALEGVVEAAREAFVGVAIADETGIETGWAPSRTPVP
jgi:hypothetical protein